MPNVNKNKTLVTSNSLTLDLLQFIKFINSPRYKIGLAHMS